MDWDSFWGSNLPSTGIDPYEPTTEQRRRILAQSLSSLGSGMVKAALSPTWGQFGLNFSQGLGAMNDVQQSEYERQMKLNQGNALFKKNMEQEDQQTKLNAQNLEKNDLELSRAHEDDDIRRGLIQAAPELINTLYETTKSILDNAQVDPSDQPKLDLARKQLETQRALALRDPQKYFEPFNTFASNAAVLAGQKKAFDETLDQKAKEHAVGLGWVHLDDNGNVIGADLNGLQKWEAESRGLQREATRANIEYTRANTEYKDRSHSGGGDDPTRGQVSFTVPQVNKEMEAIQKDIKDFQKWLTPDGKFDASAPQAAVLAKRIGLPMTPDKDGLIVVPKNILQDMAALDDLDALEDAAVRRLTARADKINAAKGKPALGSTQPAAKPGEKGEVAAPEKEVKAPTKEAVQKKIEKFGLAKVISELKKIPGMTPQKIKELYGI